MLQILDVETLKKLPIEQEFFTEEEIEILRKQLRANNARALEIVKAHGVKIHPKIKATREKQKNS